MKSPWSRLYSLQLQVNDDLQSILDALNAEVAFGGGDGLTRRGDGVARRARAALGTLKVVSTFLKSLSEAR